MPSDFTDAPLPDRCLQCCNNRGETYPLFWWTGLDLCLLRSFPFVFAKGTEVKEQSCSETVKVSGFGWAPGKPD